MPRLNKPWVEQGNYIKFHTATYCTHTFVVPMKFNSTSGAPMSFDIHADDVFPKSINVSTTNSTSVTAAYATDGGKLLAGQTYMIAKYYKASF